jgi:hypothetical protein
VATQLVASLVVLSSVELVSFSLHIHTHTQIPHIHSQASSNKALLDMTEINNIYLEDSGLLTTGSNTRI